jgi:hypothetical protein
MNSVNVILETIKLLGGILAILLPIGIAVIQYLKEKLDVSDTGAEIVSLVVGFLLSALVSWVYVAGLGYQLMFGQWIGVALFVIIGTIGPSGGYKVLGELTGRRL